MVCSPRPQTHLQFLRPTSTLVYSYFFPLLLTCAIVHVAALLEGVCNRAPCRCCFLRTTSPLLQVVTLKEARSFSDKGKQGIFVFKVRFSDSAYRFHSIKFADGQWTLSPCFTNTSCVAYVGPNVADPSLAVACSHTRYHTGKCKKTVAIEHCKGGTRLVAWYPPTPTNVPPQEEAN